MQNAKWIIGLGTAFVLMTVLSMILEGVYGTGSTVLGSFLSPVFWPPSAAWGYVKAIWAILMFDYSFFYGHWVIFRYAIFIPISAGLIVALGIEVFLRVRIPFIYN